MTSHPAVTVVTPIYNGAAFLPTAIETIAAQKYPALEHILVDDGSSDDLAAHVRRFAPHIRYLRQENRGPAAARNFAIRESRSDLIAFLDIDDLWAPDHLHRLVDALVANPEAGIAQGRIRNFVAAADGRKYFCSQPYRFYLLGSAVYRRWVFERCGGFDESMRFAEDHDYALRCWERDVLKIDVDAVTMYYRRHEASVTATKSNPVDLGLVQVYKRQLDRLRSGAMDRTLQRRVPGSTFLGAGLANHDEGLREPFA